uniref:Uncharacterized protein n=1 Tax=Rhizophora mucronata TaxID=61149 RepID=A0A2P2P315_RHIMU
MQKCGRIQWNSSLKGSS